MANGEIKKKLKLDWDKLLPSEDTDDLSPTADIVITTAAGTASKQHKQSLSMSAETPKEDLERMSDKEIDELITRQNNTLNAIGFKLPDKGEKFRNTIRRLEAEKERRKLLRLEKEVHVYETPSHSNNPHINGGSDDLEVIEDGCTKARKSVFASHFSKSMEDRQCRPEGAFDKDISYLGCRGSWKRKLNGPSSIKERKKFKGNPFQYTRSLSLDENQHLRSTDNPKARASSTGSLCQNEEAVSLSSYLDTERNASQTSTSKDARPRKEQTIDLVDEEEPPLTETTHETGNPGECLKETIYYPSRDAPELVEIKFTDMECLSPEAYLTSTIMNFYIRYLQQSSAKTSDREICDYHFFNTYFYEKLKEAVLYKGDDKETVFMKFRRWWKGVNIFQKPYVFIPIHENLHWSLVIICIPDKEDESGPIILHLDSLGFHNSRVIFTNIKRYIKQEWNHFNQEIDPPDVHISERVWKYLPRRIEEKIVLVPQQQNDYDCGLFVLYFMKRFIEEAPERLKKKDIAMFGKKWFKPQEASELRDHIRKILMEEFTKAR